MNTDCAQAEAVCAKQQLEEELDVARLAVAALNVDWSKFVDKGVDALPLPKKTKKAAAARAKKIAAATAAAAELELVKKQHQEVTSTLLASAPATAAKQPAPGEVSAGEGDSSGQSPDLLDRAISGVLAGSEN